MLVGLMLIIIAARGGRDYGASEIAPPIEL
jgi:hypothetical protein